MQPSLWNPPRDLSDAEERIVRRVKRAQLFVYLRQQRREIFALATILQAYMGISDDEVMEAMIMDRRWQLVLDCWECEAASFSKGTLVEFRRRLIASQADRRLLERTIEVASQITESVAIVLRCATPCATVDPVYTTAEPCCCQHGSSLFVL